MSGAAASQPFSRRGALGLVLFGTLVFVALLWMVGQGLAGQSTNDGGAHADGRGLNGYAALAGLLERRGHPVVRSRGVDAFAQPGLLVLTPRHSAPGREIDTAIAKHRHLGPTLLILPKWNAMPVPAAMRTATKAQEGWVILNGTRAPHWANQIRALGPLDIHLDGEAGGSRWFGLGHAGPLPGKAPVQTISSGAIVTLVRDGRGQTLAGYSDDGTAPAALTGEEPGGEPDGEPDEDGAYPLLVVAEPDLLNNYGLADRARAALALALVSGAMDAPDTPVVFDLTLAGLGRKANLLTLAFTPPFLAATLCLLLAAAATGWRAFLRFGPPRAAGRAIAFGKRALVTNAAGLIVRSRRLHLLGRPYAEAARQRLVRVLALPRGGDLGPRGGDDGAELTALDRAAKAHGVGDRAVSQAFVRLTQARSERELVKAAHDLHALERTLTQ
jgi:hypothetical protein